MRLFVDMLLAFLSFCLVRSFSVLIEDFFSLRGRVVRRSGIPGMSRTGCVLEEKAAERLLD